ncbi:MAG TPA: flavodoxin domain-containing protein [Dehalococcoidia bacterium]|nr:flavodoxin domain-containing protein [Dehalococcoidia bacterium]
MKILVGYASKYGATDGIAEQIACVLNGAGLDATLSSLDGAKAEGYDAFVIGSGVYAGSWLKSARQFVETNRETLASRPVWLFSSGPVGDPPKPEGEPQGVLAIHQAVKAREHRVFAGKLEKRRLNLVEKALTSALKAPDGDFRDWDSIRAWADEIVAALPATIEARR